MSNYGNRSDLNTAPTQPAKAATGQQYGAAGQQIASQQQVPLPDAPPLPPFDAPTARPNEHVTHGVPTGPGPGPAEAGLPQGPIPEMSVADTLRAIYTVYPTDDLMDLILTLENQ